MPNPSRRAESISDEKTVLRPLTAKIGFTLSPQIDDTPTLTSREYLLMSMVKLTETRHASPPRLHRCDIREGRDGDTLKTPKNPYFDSLNAKIGQKLGLRRS